MKLHNFGDTMDRWDELERLGRLRDEGLLSNEEFEAEKRRLLASDRAGAAAATTGTGASAAEPESPPPPTPVAATAPPTAAPAPPPLPPLDATPPAYLPVDSAPPASSKRGLMLLAAACAVIVGGVGMGWAYSQTGTSNKHPVAAEAPAKAKTTKEAAATYAFQSQVSGATFEPLAELPTVKPYDGDQDGYCDQPISATTAGGSLAEKRGWRVMKEAKYHDLDAVLMVRGFDPGTSGHCFPKDANVAFFEGDKLLGTLSAAGKNGIGINTFENIGGYLRIWDDLMPVGQIDLTSKTFTFAKVTGSDEVCGGKYRVPTAFGKPYSKARELFGKAGWNPTINTEDTGGDTRTDDYRSRFPETGSCAGTGYAYCSFELQASKGPATLAVTTAGEDEDPRVVGYDVSCDGQSSE